MIVYTMLSMENTAEICNEDVGPSVGVTEIRFQAANLNDNERGRILSLKGIYSPVVHDR